MTRHLDWSAYEHTDAFGFGDAFGASATTGDGFSNALDLCKGHQRCLTHDSDVMCPSYRVTADEQHSPFHRARILREALTSASAGEQGFDSAQVQAAIELCVGCKGCKRECPNGMDVALAVTEARAHARSLGGKTSWRDRLFATLPRQVGRLRRLRPVMRLIESTPGINRLVRRAAGIASKRRLPVPDARSFDDRHPAQSYGDGQRGDVVLLIDTFSNHFEPAVAEAALGLLIGLGYRVHLPKPPEQAPPLCCGRTYLSKGMIDDARAMASQTLELLLPYAKAGMPVIGLEPSCLLMLRDEYRSLGLGTNVATVARQAVMIEEFLVRLADEDADALRLNPMHDRQILVHGHCHQKAFGTMTAVERLLAAIPGAFVTPIQSGCCGMAGAFGYEAEHYEISMRMAEDRLMPAVRNAPTGAVIVANGTSCRQQIRHGSGRRPLHLVELLFRQLAPSAQDASGRAGSI